jgi:hypothetical protein
MCWPIWVGFHSSFGYRSRRIEHGCYKRTSRDAHDVEPSTLTRAYERYDIGTCLGGLLDSSTAWLAEVRCSGQRSKDREEVFAAETLRLAEVWAAETTRHVSFERGLHPLTAGPTTRGICQTALNTPMIPDSRDGSIPLLSRATKAEIRTGVGSGVG